MHLIIGGAYMGKLDFAIKTYGFTPEQICDCANREPDLSFPCLRHLEEYVYRCVQRGEEPMTFFRDNREALSHSVLICRDISGGVVPMEKTDRLWRAAAGQLCQYLSKESDRVSRIFCGLEQRLK